MSDGPSAGYGSTHEWKRGRTCAAQITDYRCRRCGRIFAHHYKRMPDMSAALRDALVGECPQQQPEEVA